MSSLPQHHPLANTDSLIDHSPTPAMIRSPAEHGDSLESEPASSSNRNSLPLSGSAQSSSSAQITPMGHRGPNPRERGVPPDFSFKRRSSRGAAGGGSLFRRASFGVFSTSANDEESSGGGGRWRGLPRSRTRSSTNTQIGRAIRSEDKPHAPRILPPRPAPRATPIPTLPFVVLCLVVFGEFLSAGVAGPFLFFMVESFHVGGESDVGFWAGITSSAFFLTQCLTAVLWASVAEAHGRRAVLIVALVGNALSLAMFGVSTNLRMAIAVRLAQGLFNGAVGVAKGAVRDITDSTNEGVAYSILGFAWGFGGILGPIIGGLLEHPADKFPSLFPSASLFDRYPYLLPCVIGASFTATGAILALFIGPDGGPRTGFIRLPEKLGDVERATSAATSNMGSLGRASKRVSGYFSSAKSASDDQESVLTLHPTTDVVGPSSGLGRTFTQQVDDETGGPPSPIGSDDGSIVTDIPEDQRGLSGRLTPLSRTTARQRASISVAGSAYGYDSSDKQSRAQSFSRDSRSQYAALGRSSVYTNNAYAPDFEDLDKRSSLSFAQRFLLANDDTVLSLTDLWVAAAINGDESVGPDEDVFDDDDEGDLLASAASASGILEDEAALGDSVDSMAGFGDDSPLLAPRPLAPLRFAQRKNSRAGVSDDDDEAGTAYTRRDQHVPSLYANTGLERPLSPVSSLSPFPRTFTEQSRPGTYDRTLVQIPERNSMHFQQGGTETDEPQGQSDADGSIAPAPSGTADSTSVFGLLPLVFIAHYGMMSFHSSTFDQIFMTFLVTPYTSGGLGLSSQHYAELIAAMAAFQVLFQFHTYPQLQSRWSHLTMLRLGLAVYLPSYALFPTLRAFLHPSTDVLVMGGMIAFAATRWMANIFAFTAITILLNASCPPRLVPLANGLAQTVSSAARFIGPIVGGLVWGISIKGRPEDHSWPFDYHMGFYFVGVIGFLGLVLSYRIK